MLYIFITPDVTETSIEQELYLHGFPLVIASPYKNEFNFKIIFLDPALYPNPWYIEGRYIEQALYTSIQYNSALWTFLLIL